MSGWIGVDLDGTLAVYKGWGNGEIGLPVYIMLKRVLEWVKEGREVRIFTARASVPEEIKKVEDWCVKYIGIKLPVTNVKDFGMIELWDDRAIRVIPNTGLTCCSNREGK